jgi:hypothetical protein
MKKTMTEYISVLSDNDFLVLEDIIGNKYRKFLTLYWMLKDYSDYIYSLKYKESKHDILKIEVCFSNIKTEKVLNKLHKKIPDNYTILIYDKKEKIYIEISKEEE